MIKVTQQSSSPLVANSCVLFTGSHKPLQAMKEVRTTHQTLTTAERKVGAAVNTKPEQRWTAGDE